MFFPRARGFFPALLAILAVAIAAAAGAQNAATVQAPALSSDQIVEQMQAHDQARVRMLKRYHSTRHYAVAYRGFPSDLEAGMVVEASFDEGAGKSFKIVSQTGSKFLSDKVIKRALDSEKEASQDKGSTALTPKNYKFRLLGSEIVGGRPAYILAVEPHVPSKFLYRGKIWIDAVDFGTVKIQTEPSKSPSFWISRTEIDCANVKAGDFWLPGKLRSETKVRIGGGAVFTIDYGTYEVETKGP